MKTEQKKSDAADGIPSPDTDTWPCVSVLNGAAILILTAGVTLMIIGVLFRWIEGDQYSRPPYYMGVGSMLIFFAIALFLIPMVTRRKKHE